MDQYLVEPSLTITQSQVIKAGGFVFLAGQVPTDNKAKEVEGTVADKTHKMCQNTKAVLEAAGSSLDKVVKVTVREPLNPSKT